MRVKERAILINKRTSNVQRNSSGIYGNEHGDGWWHDVMTSSVEGTSWTWIFSKHRTLPSDLVIVRPMICRCHNNSGKSKLFHELVEDV